MTPTNPVRAALLVLSFGAGATDAFAFLLLGGIFSANMTGNMVLAALVGRPGYLATLLGAVAAILAFAAAAYVGFVITRAPDQVPGRARALAGTGAVAQLAVLVAWLLLGAAPGLGGAVALVAVSSLAMGLQTVVGRRLMPQLTTTYQTGTLASVLQDLAEHRRGGRRMRLASIGALIAGAACGALVIWVAPALAALPPALAAVAGAALLLATGPRIRPAESPSVPA